ncbi:porin [Candidatus Pelagibacter sp. HIMB1715]|uniref:porin n=1 Tax=Candidatus Pelagibacter sp. HIMB1715 TaxID=3413369 RepID=UPI003F849DA2
MNNIKKIGLTALAASLVSVSANAGEMSVTGSASMNVEGFSGEQLNAGTGYSMGNQLTFSGGGELDNGINVSLSFVLDQGDGDPGPFDSHSVSISTDMMGTLTLNGEGGTTTANNIDKSAAGDIWDKFDGLTNASAQVNKQGDTATATAGDNSFYYSSPELMEGLTVNASYQPQGSNRTSGTGLGAAYSNADYGLTLNYAEADVVGATEAKSGTETVIKASWAYGPVTLSYSDLATDIEAASSDYDLESFAVSYTVNDEISITYGMEDITQEGATSDAEYETISASYTAGGMTISAGIHDAENANFGTNSNQDFEKWTLGASFAF